MGMVVKAAILGDACNCFLRLNKQTSGGVHPET
jgi:hypothetical protein